MTEDEYIKVTNKTAILCALDSMRHVMGGDVYGVDDGKRAKICNLLSELRDECFDSIKIKVE